MPKQHKKPPILETVDLRLSRGSTTILDGVSWRVEAGQHWAMIGPNGCGKTSLLRTLTGYLSATAGDIYLLGKRYGEADWRDLRTRIGIVSSALQPSIPPAERAIETVISGKFAQLDLWAKTTPADFRQGKKWLNHVGLGHLADRVWLYLSQGERQRVLIARALMARPRLLILDEPCSGLDPLAREDFLQFIQHLGTQPRSPALVLVTHHIEEVMPVFTHALLLRAGKIVRAGLKADTLRSRWMTHAFEHPLRVRRSAGRFHLTISGLRKDPNS